MSHVTNIRPLTLKDLILSDQEQRIYDQAYRRGYERGLAEHECPKASTPPKMDAYERGLRRRIAWFRERADIALERGDDARAAQLEAWAASEADILYEKYGVHV